MFVFANGELVPIPTFCDVSTVIAVVPEDWIVSAVAEALVMVEAVSVPPTATLPLESLTMFVVVPAGWMILMVLRVDII